MLNNRVLATPFNMGVPSGYIQSQFKIGQWTVSSLTSINPPTVGSIYGWGWMTYQYINGQIGGGNKGSLAPSGAIDGITGGEKLTFLGIHPVDKTIIFEGREYKNNQDCSNTPLAAAWKDGAVLTIFVPQGGGNLLVVFVLSQGGTKC